MKEYNAIFIGTGSAMNILGALAENEPEWKMAVIDKDEPGGICLTRGCIPSKMLLYPADVVATVRSAARLGIETQITKIDFARVMETMAKAISGDIEQIRHGLQNSPNVDYYPFPAEFTAPYTLKVGNDTLKAPLIFLCTGSRPLIPPIKGLDKAGYLTSDTVLLLRKLPPTIGIIGGGYIAAEYGHFFSAMGSKVTIIGRDKQFLPREEPDIARVFTAKMRARMTILTNHDCVEIAHSLMGRKTIVAVDRATDRKVSIATDEILVAVGRASNSDVLHPENAGIKTGAKGWIEVNDYLETSVPGIWAFGDALGKHQFKHVANYESIIAYRNAIQKMAIKPDYHAVPHAVFGHPEVASVGLGEKDALEKYGKDKILVGMCRYEDTAKGQAMGETDSFVKLIAENDGEKIIGAHIVGPQASVLLQEIVNLMYAPHGSAHVIKNGMHIHPALSEVVERAAGGLMPYDQYQHMLMHLRGKHHHEGH